MVIPARLDAPAHPHYDPRSLQMGRSDTPRRDPTEYFTIESDVKPRTAQLIGVTGDLAGQSFPVAGTLLIGRLDSADVCISHLEVSRRHCQIEQAGDKFQLTDLGSRSGTRVNDVPIKTSALKSGDLIAVGPVVFRFESHTGRTDLDEFAPMTMAIDNAEAQLTLKEILLSDFNLAKQIGTATEQRTLERLRRHLEVVQEFADVIQTTLDTTALIEKTLDELFRVFGKMDAGVIFLRSQMTGQLEPAAIRRRGTSDSGPVGYSTTILRSVEAERKAVVLLDVSQDARFQHAVSVRMGAMRTHMCVPLLVRGEVVGAIYLVAEGQESAATGFDDDDLGLLSALSGTVAVCVKNAALAAEAKRNEKLSSSLQRYVSADVTKRLIEQGVSGALGARTVEGVAMFCDLVGFTTFSEQLPPERMARLLNRYFRRALDIVFSRHGSVNKFSGDAFLAVWGAIESSPDDMFDAIRAALEIQNDVFRLSTETANEGIGSIQLTIGLNRGRFFAGDIGSEDRMEFTVIGDSVNIAARIQSLAHAGQVLTTLYSLDEDASRMNLTLYPDEPIRGRTSGVTIASIRSVRIGHPTSLRETAATGSPSQEDSTLTPEHKRPIGDRVLASIPIEIRELGARAVVTGAVLGVRIEIELLADKPFEVDRTYQLVATLPEWPAPLEPVEAVCIASLAEAPVHLVRLRLLSAKNDLVSLLNPRHQRQAVNPLRKKT
jgi:adenylate cyclase